VSGKTVSEALPTIAAVRKAEREISEYRKFKTLVQSFLDVNAKICRLRPLGEKRSGTSAQTGKRNRVESGGRTYWADSFF